MSAKLPVHIFPHGLSNTRGQIPFIRARWLVCAGMVILSTLGCSVSVFGIGFPPGSGEQISPTPEFTATSPVLSPTTTPTPPEPLDLVALRMDTISFASTSLGLGLNYPASWHLQVRPSGTPYSLLLTTFDPAAPPHKLEWDSQTMSLGITVLPPGSAPLDLASWVTSAREAALSAQLEIFVEESLELSQGWSAVRLTLVSGSGGIIDQVLVNVGGKAVQVDIQGNFDLAKVILDTLHLAQGLKPPDSDSLVSGICAVPETGIMEITLTDDGPAMPRCAQVTGEKRLKLINGKHDIYQAMFAHFEIDLPPGGAVLLDQNVGDYLAPGIHYLDGAEIMLLEN